MCNDTSKFRMVLEIKALVKPVFELMSENISMKERLGACF